MQSRLTLLRRDHFTHGSRLITLGVLVLLSAAPLLTGCLHSKTRLELAETYYNLGNAYTELGEWEKAGDAYLRAIELDPSLKRAGFQMARVYVHAGEYGKAEEILEELRKEDPGNQELREYLAWIHVKRGESGEAKHIYKKILEENPADCDVRFNLAKLEAEDGEWRRSYEQLAACLDYDITDAQIYRLLGKVKLELGEEGAVGFLEKAYAQKPDMPGLAGELARAYRSAERYGKAIEIYDEMLTSAEKSARKAEIRFEKAFVYLTAIEDYERGITSLRAALEAGYRNEEEFEELIGYPRLLDPERIRELFREFDIELPEQGSPSEPEAPEEEREQEQEQEQEPAEG